MRNPVIVLVALCALASLAPARSHGQAAPKTIDPKTINAHANSLCLVPVKIPIDGSAVTPTKAPTSDLPPPLMNVQERGGALLGPFRAGDPLSSPALPSLKPIAVDAKKRGTLAESQQGGATLETSSEDSRAALVYSRVSSTGGGKLGLSTIELSAPLNKEGDTSIHRMGEFASDARLKVSRTWFERTWKANQTGMPPARVQDLQGTVLTNIKKEVREDCESDLTKDSQECRDKLELIDKLEAQHILLRGDCINKYAKANYAEYIDSYFAPQASWFGGLTASVGYLEFDFKNSSTFEDESKDETPWSAGVFFGRYSADRKNLFRVGYDYVRGYKAASDSIVCRVPDPTLPPQCQSGKFQGPDDDDSDSAFAEVRRTLPWKFVQAVTVKYSYDFDAKKSEVDVPVYLFKNKKGDLNGGVRVDWNEKDDFGIGVFVGAAFSTDF